MAMLTAQLSSRASATALQARLGERPSQGALQGVVLLLPPPPRRPLLAW